MYITFENNEQKGQALDILLALGYQWHGETELTTSKEIIERWGSYMSLEVGYGAESKSIQGVNTTFGNTFSWFKEFSSIMSRLENFAIEKVISISEVGDYSADVYKDKVVIYEQEISHDTVRDIYNAFTKKEEVKWETLNITTVDDAAHMALMSLLYSFGYEHSSSNNAVEAHEQYKEYNSTVVYNDKRIGGNYRYYGDGGPEYVFPRDLVEIVELVSVGTIEKDVTFPMIGDYDVKVKGNSALVGCQRISKTKVKEIIDAIESFKS